MPVVPAPPHGDERLHVDDDGQVEDDKADLREDNDGDNAADDHHHHGEDNDGDKVNYEEDNL